MSTKTTTSNSAAGGTPAPAVSEKSIPSSGPDSETNRPARGRVHWIIPSLLLAFLAVFSAGLAVWKANAIEATETAAANQPEPVESITTAFATERQHRNAATSIGTVVALRSITLRNELAGTVREAKLTPGQIVEAGTLLVALDVSVEEAELKAQKAQAALAQTVLERLERAVLNRATSQMEVDRARAELDVARAQIARLEAILARKTIRAPFRARIGISDVHPGQYLEEGTPLTTLQSVDTAVHVDFSVSQQVAQGLRVGETVEIVTGAAQPAIPAQILALDSRVDPVTRNTTVRARIENAEQVPYPGASVRVRVPAGEPQVAVSIPASALRRGPSGDHVFVIAPDEEGHPRAERRRVETGPALGDEVLVLSGLSDGEQVAAQGSFKLRESVLVAFHPTGRETGAVN